MRKKNKVKIIEGFEHRGDRPKAKGNLLRCVDKCPFWLTIVIFLVIIAMEMLGFACLYCAMSSSPFIDSVNYSLFSVLGETVGASVRNALYINWLIPLESVLTNCIISLYMGIVLYKLISMKPKIIEMEDHLVFDPETGTLRLRMTNASWFKLTNVQVVMNFRIYISNGNRHANARLLLKKDILDVVKPFAVWNIATKPFQPQQEADVQLNVKRFDSDRIYEFIPDLLNEKYRSGDMEIAKNTDYEYLTVIFTMKSPFFGSEWVYSKSYTVEQFVCGELEKIEKNELGKKYFDWSNWERYKDTFNCETCVYANHCSIIKKNHSTIK